MRNGLHIVLRITMMCISVALFCSNASAEIQYTKATTGAHTFTNSSALSSGTWVKIALNDNTDGIYQITYSQLRSMGFNNPANVGVFGFGAHTLPESFASNHIDDVPEVATYHDAANQRILFYGRGLIEWTYNNSSNLFTQRQHPYATQSCYFLHEKENMALAMDTLADNIASGNVNVSTYNDYQLHELESTNISKTGRELYGESFIYTQSQDFTFSIPGIVNDSALFTANFIAYSAVSSTISMRVNDKQVASNTIASTSDSYTRAKETTINTWATSLSNGAITVRIGYSCNATPTIARLNYIRVQSMRTLQLYNSYTLFRRADAGISTRYNITDYDASSMQVWDVTSPTNVSVQSVTNSAFTPTQSGVREYALVNLKGSFNGVTSLGTVNNQDLHNLPQTEMVIIVPNALKSYAEELAEYRRTHDSLHVTVVTSSEIYNEFSSGVPDATAYRLFMKMFYDRGQIYPNDNQIQYLLLFGDGYYNNRATSNSNYYLLCYETEASLVETSSAVCDDYFGFLDDNEGGKLDSNLKYNLRSDVLDIGIGRFPVHTTTDAENVLNKTLQYSQNTDYGIWKNRLCFLGDDGDTWTHMQHADEMVSLLEQAGHHEFIYKKIYLDAYQRTSSATGTEYPDAEKEFQECLQQGVLLINYSGHGSTNNITHENIMTTAKAEALNMKHLPVWVTATCDFSRFDDDETSCGETLLLNPNGGAAAMVTTTRVVYAYQNKTLNTQFIKNVFNKHSNGTRYRMGDIMRQAKVALGTDFNKLNFCLLGDPSLTLAYPEYEMEITSINGQSVSEAKTFDLPSLSSVTMQGRVKQVGSAETDTTFNGLIYPTIFDAEETITAVNNDDNDGKFTFKSRKKKVFAGRDVIANGTFEFSYIVPQDISYSSGCGLVNLYGCSENGEEGQGYSMNFTLSGSTAGVDQDTIAPVIKTIFINENTFKDGDIVNATPYFYAEVYDESGFNTTGNSIGHDMTITLKCTSNNLLANTQYVLNEYFTTYTGNSTLGNVRYSIPKLEDGTYQLIFHVWDVYNNSARDTLNFTVKTASSPRPLFIQAYPSPVHNDEIVTFKVVHDRPESQSSLTIQVFTEMGVKVYETKISSSTSDVLYVSEDAKSSNYFVGDNALNADETSRFYGVNTVTWNKTSNSGGYLAPGLYVYRVYMTSDGSASVSETQKLFILGNNKSE